MHSRIKPWQVSTYYVTHSKAGHMARIRRCINPLTPNDPYRGRTAPLTSKVAFYIFIQQI